jgi:uncharacterized repeat protein (TIGR03803 family)
MRPLRNLSLSKFSWWTIARALLLLCATSAITSQAQTFTSLYSFSGTDGSAPYTLVQGTGGDLHGTAFFGGTSSACSGGCGTAFKFALSGTLTTLFSFDGTNGNAPNGVIQATNGNFYGTALEGGANCIADGGCGTVFKISLVGVPSTIYSFCILSNCTDGSYPGAVAFQGTDGNLYGSTEEGGANCVADGGCGTVFEITPAGKLTTLYSFCTLSNCADGSFPGLAFQGTDGNFYGVTSYGGASSTLCGGVGCGTVFKLTPAKVLTTLYSFCAQSSCADGSSPWGLIQATDGNFYGTTFAGGTSSACTNGCGTFFRLTPSGTLTTLLSFCSLRGCADGALPQGILQATDGNFYGTTRGTNRQGTLFKITRRRVLTTLYSFCSQTGCTDGAFPNATPVQDTNGKIYGTTLEGGASNDGTIYSLSVGLYPFVETQTSSGKVGGAVKILGTNLTGATGVTFNGTAAVFTVVSSSLITTTVPTGASTGFVAVTTPSGMLKSNKKFRVTP